MDVGNSLHANLLEPKDGTQTAAAAAAAAAVPQIRPRSIIVSDFTQIQARDLFVSDLYGNARAFLVGFVACCVLEIHFYVSGGCDAATGAKEEYGHQVSNQMCCLTDWWIGAIGLGATGLLALQAAPGVFRRRGALGRCCRWRCWSGNGAGGGCRGEGGGGLEAAPFVAVCQALSAAGLVILAVAQMCWRVYWHAFGALLFFGFGMVMSGLVVFSARGVGSSSSSGGGGGSGGSGAGGGSALSRAVRALVLVLMAASFVVGTAAISMYIAEWLLIMGISAAIASVQLDLFLFEKQSTIIIHEADADAGNILDQQQQQLAGTPPVVV